MVRVARVGALAALAAAMLLAAFIPMARGADPAQPSPAAAASPVAKCAAGLIRIRDGRHHWKCITPDQDYVPAVLIAPRVCERDSDCEHREVCDTNLHAPGHPTEGTCYPLR
jgi:hypothetical protein